MSQETDISAIRAMLDEVIRAIPRLESSLQRNFENVNITRHSLNHEMQKIVTDLGMLSIKVQEVLKLLLAQGELLNMASSVGGQVKGGWKMANLLWPMLTSAVSILAGYYLGKH